MRGGRAGRYTASHEHCVLKCDNADFFLEYGQCAARDHHAHPSSPAARDHQQPRVRPQCGRDQAGVAGMGTIRVSIPRAGLLIAHAPISAAFDGAKRIYLSWIAQMFPSPSSPCRPSSTSARTPMRCVPPAGSPGRGRCIPTPWGPKSTSGPQPSSRGEDDAP